MRGNLNAVPLTAGEPHLGLSPRVRGNLADNWVWVCGCGSIPAAALLLVLLRIGRSRNAEGNISYVRHCSLPEFLVFATKHIWAMCRSSR